MKNNKIELIRFVAAAIIMIFHFTGYSPGALPTFVGGYIWVEFFFILTGYFTYAHIKKVRNDISSDQSASYAWCYTKRKFQNIFPVTCTFVSITYLLYIYVYMHAGNTQGILSFIFNYPVELLYLFGFGAQINLCVNTYWYLSALICTLPLFSIIVLKFEDFFDNYIAIFGPVMLYSIFWVNGSIMPQSAWLGMVPLSLIRAFAGLILGASVYRYSRKIHLKQDSKRIKVLATVVEIAAFLGAVYISWKSTTLDMFCIFLFAVMLTMAFSDCTWGIKPNKVCEILGDLALPIYLSHWTLKDVINTFFEQYDFKYRFVLMVSATMIVSMLILYIQTYWKKKCTKADEKQKSKIN